MPTAEELFNDTFRRFSKNWTFVLALRQVSETGLPFAQRTLAKQHSDSVDFMSTDPEYRKMFGNGDEPFPDSLKELLGKGLTDLVVTSASAATDAALLLLAHSILDDCAISYCRVCALAKPEDWDGFIEKKHVEFQSAKINTLDAIRRELIDSRLKVLDKESLPEKIDMLHRLCKPPQGYAPLRDYSYDRETLKRIDLDRHKVVHYGGFTNAAPNLQQDLDFVNKTAWYLMGLVNQRYGLKIDLRHFFGLQTATPQEMPPPAE